MHANPISGTSLVGLIQSGKAKNKNKQTNKYKTKQSKQKSGKVTPSKI